MGEEAVSQIRSTNTPAEDNGLSAAAEPCTLAMCGLRWVVLREVARQVRGSAKNLTHQRS